MQLDKKEDNMSVAWEHKIIPPFWSPKCNQLQVLEEIRVSSGCKLHNKYATI